MKRNNYKKMAFVVLFAMTIVAYFEACKKEVINPATSTMTPLEHQDYTDDARKIVAKIKTFRTQMADKECLMRSGECMPLDSVIWNVEALFNATYTFPERKYVETVKQNLSFFVDINKEGEVPLSVVYDLYDDVTEAVRQAYAGDGISTDKSLMAVVVSKGEIVGNTAEVNVIVVSGKVASGGEHDKEGGPFGPGDCWYFGEYGGTCEDPSVFGDAAEMLEDTINYYYGGTPVPQTGFRTINFSMKKVVLEGNEFYDENGNPYLFYYNFSENPNLYLDYDYLNWYYARELVVLLNLEPTTLMNENLLPIVPAFLSVNIEGLINNGHYCHRNSVIYCSSLMIPEEELGPVREIL